MSVAITATMVAIGWRDILTPLSRLGIGERLAVSAYSLVFYLSKTVAPWAGIS